MRKDVLGRLVKAGLPMRKIGQLLGVSATTVYRRVVRLGISDRRRRRSIGRAETKRILQLSNEGITSVRKIARLAGVTWHSASRVLDAHQQPRIQPPSRCSVCGSRITIKPCLICRARNAKPRRD